MKKTAKPSKTIRANNRKTKLKAKHRRQRAGRPRDQPSAPDFTATAGQIVGAHHSLAIGRRHPGARN